MSIAKLDLDFVGPYERIPQETVELFDDLEALALWVYLVSKPENWQIRRQQVMRRWGIGETKYKKLLSVLRSLGLLERVEERDENGRFIARVIKISSVTGREIESDSCENMELHEEPPGGKPTGRQNNPVAEHPGGKATRRPATPLKQDIGDKHDKEEKQKKEDKQLSLLPDSDSDSGKPKTKPKAKNSPSEYTEEFEAFWEGYPHRAGKGDASKTWKKLKDDQKAAIKAHLALNPYAGREKQHIPHGSTYLSKKKWEDEVITTNQKTRSMYA